MKNKYFFDSKGFMLVETLLVSLTISGILIYMYAQFSTINNAYQKLYDYDTTDSLYRTASLREFLMTYTNVGKDVYYSGLTAKVVECWEPAYPDQYTDEQMCNGIVSAMDAKLIILTMDNMNVNTVLNKVGSSLDNKERAKVEKYLATVLKDSSSSKYRLVVLYNDGTMATVLLKK